MHHLISMHVIEIVSVFVKFRVDVMGTNFEPVSQNAIIYYISCDEVLLTLTNYNETLLTWTHNGLWFDI